MQELQELKIKSYLYKLFKELVTKPIREVDEKVVESYLRNLTEDSFEYINKQLNDSTSTRK